MSTQDDLLTQTGTGDAIIKRYSLTVPKKELDAWPPGDQKFVQADEVGEIAALIIDKFGMDAFVSHINMGYLFRKTATKAGGEVVLGTIKVEPDIERTLHGYDAIMIIGYDIWKTLDADQKFRLVYSKLCQVVVDYEKGKISIISPTASEFPEVMKIFGPNGDAQINLLAAYEHFKSNNR